MFAAEAVDFEHLQCCLQQLFKAVEVIGSLLAYFG